MKHEVEQYELIENYLSGKLKGKELIEVKDRIQNDADFSAEVLKHAKFHNFIFEQSMVDMKDKIKTIHKQSQLPVKGKFGWRNIFSYLGALLITGGVFLGFWGKNEYDHGRLFVFNKNITDTISTANNTVEQVAIKRPKKSITEPIIPITDSTIQVDSTSISDTTISASEPSELALSDILNSVAPPVEPEQGTKKLVEDVKAKTITDRKSDPNCIDVEIEARVETENSCNNKSTGKITIDPQDIRGGEAPYRISIDGSKNFYDRFVFSNLLPKSYELLIKDANNCVAALGKIVIDQIDCSYEYVFSPDKGEIWVIPTQESAGNIKIYNKRGKLVYSTNFDMSGTYEWNGRSNSEDELPMGVYMFELRLEQQEPMYGNITLVR